MAIDQPKFTDLLKPQDALAVLITLMGLAIVIFLDDTIVKGIGGSIAVLGIVAVAVAVRQRRSEQVRFRPARPVIPPPSFKTSVVTDPATNVTRIVFDDFSQTFAPGDDDPGEQGEIVRPVLSVESVPQQREHVERRNEPSSSPRVRSIDRAQPALDTMGAMPLPDLGHAPLSTPSETAAVEPPAQPNTPSPPVLSFDDLSGAEDEGSFRVLPSTPRPEPAATPRSAQPSLNDQGVDRQPSPADHRPPASSPQPSITAVPHPLVAPPLAVEAVAPVAVPVDNAPKRFQAASLVEDLISDGEDDPRSSEPRTEFVRLVGQALTAIGRSIEARSIVFFWVNFEKGHVIPEACVTSAGVEVRTGARIPMGSDVVSQIAASGIPEIITDISPAAERDLIAYYARPVGTRSFVGVPVFFRREVVGVLGADSAMEQGFGEGSVATLAEYTRLISGLIRSYTEKYDLQLVSRTLEAFEEMVQDFTGTAPSPSLVARQLVSKIAHLFDNASVSVVLFDDTANTWRTVAWEGADVADDPRALPLAPQGAVLRAVRRAEEILLDPYAGEIRFAEGERRSAGGTFVALPMIGTTRCYGAMVIEHPMPGAYIQRDIELMRDLARYASMAVEVFFTNRAIEAQAAVDESTGVFNREFLLATLDREIARSVDFRSPLSLALVSIDLPQSLREEESPELEEIITVSVGSMIQSSLRSYDTVGRLGSRQFAVVLAERGDQDAYIWAEKLRKDVASRILALGERKSAVTISIGICDRGEMTESAGVVDGARQALQRAQSTEGNAVILY